MKSSTYDPDSRLAEIPSVKLSENKDSRWILEGIIILFELARKKSCFKLFYCKFPKIYNQCCSLLNIHCLIEISFPVNYITLCHPAALFQFYSSISYSATKYFLVSLGDN